MFCKRTSHIAWHNFHPGAGQGFNLAHSATHGRGRSTKISNVFDGRGDISDGVKSFVGQINLGALCQQSHSLRAQLDSRMIYRNVDGENSSGTVVE